jgi:hypothetical protein
METKSISYNIAKFTNTKDVGFLVKAVVLVLKQGRTLELVYGSYCKLFFPPSAVKNYSYDFLKHVDRRMSRPEIWLSRETLIEYFGEKFDVRSLPDDFDAARRASVVYNSNCLIIGEYGDRSARIAYITRDSCRLIEFYNRIDGVRHIHSILECNDSGDYLISTGDSRKFLDLWTTGDGRLNFVKRIKKHFAGYTAAISINNRYYFGTDFSNRPNYIETLDGDKYFYPKIAYKQFVDIFYSFLDRYLVSINSDMPYFGGRKTLSIFDTLKEEFVFCDYLDRLQKDN